jgi:hypothetical protein
MPVLRRPHDHRRDLRAQPPSPRSAGMRPPRCRAMIRNHAPSTSLATGAHASGCPSIAPRCTPRSSDPPATATPAAVMPATPSTALLHHHPRAPVGPPAAGQRAAAAETLQPGSRNPHRPRPPPAGSLLGGFRTPAPQPAPTSRWAGIRNPSHVRTPVEGYTITGPTRRGPLTRRPPDPDPAKSEHSSQYSMPSATPHVTLEAQESAQRTGYERRHDGRCATAIDG